METPRKLAIFVIGGPILSEVWHLLNGRVTPSLKTLNVYLEKSRDLTILKFQIICEATKSNSKMPSKKRKQKMLGNPSQHFSVLMAWLVSFQKTGSYTDLILQVCS